MTNRINGFGFSGYRSFGGDLVKIAPLRKINLIIGQNNSGKSNIIRFLYQHLAACNSACNGKQLDASMEFSNIDLHNSSTEVNLRVAYPILPSADLESYISTNVPEKSGVNSREIAKKLLESDAFADDNGIVWFIYKAKSKKGPFELEYSIDKLKSAINNHEWRALWNAITTTTGGSLEQHWIPETLQRLIRPPKTIPQVEFIPAIREIGQAGSEPKDFSGSGIIERLARLQNPPVENQVLKEDFEAINEFARSVLENPEATIEIPYERDTVLVHMDGRTLPLSSLGTGIHEVLILAAAATILKKSVLCVEEPELHIHPLLQKKLLQYLNERTDNQYIFTTHSAHLLDAVPAEIFHVIKLDSYSTVNAIASTRERSQICVDLGYRASDILQANSVIWVEGPSDRIYVNYWLNAINDKLVEGVHYSIMFYGGRLASHLSGLDEDEVINAINDFVSLRKLNRNSVIFLDSDKRSGRASISSTKLRLKDEFDYGPGFAWITSGREVENYLNEEFLDLCIKEVHPSTRQRLEKGKWGNLLKYEEKRTGKERIANKVKVARKYIENHEADLSNLDLQEQIMRLTEFIVKANGLEI